ncbi:hypothetical protein [Pantoea sp. SGAir0418]|jgi:hypothetical protein
MKAFSEIDNDIMSIIDECRIERKKEERKGANLLPKDLRFLFKSNVFQINELLNLCHGDYRQIMTVLITKKTPENVKCYDLINKFRNRPFIFITLLSCHPASQVRVKGGFKYAAVKILKKNKRAFDLARKIHHKIRG